MGNHSSLQTQRGKSNLTQKRADIIRPYIKTLPYGSVFLYQPSRREGGFLHFLQKDLLSHLFIQNLSVFMIEFLEGSVFDFFADFRHHFVIKPKVMENAKAHSKAFVRF